MNEAPATVTWLSDKCPPGPMERGGAEGGSRWTIESLDPDPTPLIATLSERGDCVARVDSDNVWDSRLQLVEDCPLLQLEPRRNASKGTDVASPRHSATAATA